MYLCTLRMQMNIPTIFESTSCYMAASEVRLHQGTVSDAKDEPPDLKLGNEPFLDGAQGVTL